MDKELKAKLEELRQTGMDKIRQAEQNLIIQHSFQLLFPELKIMYVDHNLYGSTGCIYLRTEWYSSLLEGKRNPEYKDVLRISELLPPIPMTMVRDSCLSFRPTAFVDAIPEEKKKYWKEETEVVPFKIKLSCFQNNSMSFEWFSMFEGKIIAVNCELPMDSKIAYLYMKMVSSAYRGKKIKEMVLIRNNNNIYTIYGKDGNPQAELQQAIKWAAGGDNTPNDYSLFWIAYDSSKYIPTIADLLRPIMTD